MKTKKYNILFFSIGLLALIYMIWKIGVDTIWDNITKTGFWFIPIIGVWVIVYLLNTMSWNSIIKCNKKESQHISFWKLFRVTISGYAINYITPVVALGGEPYRILELKPYMGGKRATSSVLLYSMMHILSHFVFWMAAIVLMIIYLKPVWSFLVLLSVLFLLLGFFCYLFLEGYKKGLIVKTIRILSKIPFLKKPVRRFQEKQLDNLIEVDKQITQLHTHHRGAFYKSLFLEFFSRVVSCLEYYIIAKVVAYDMTFLDAIIVYAGSTLIANALFFSPMQLGTREGGLALAFKSVSMPLGLGVYVGLITRIRELFWILVGLIFMRIKPGHPEKTDTIENTEYAELTEVKA